MILQRIRLAHLILFTLVCIGNKIIAQNNFEIRYLGNMGVAILHNDSAVIIDGLHDFYERYYLPTDTALLKAMLQKKSPFTSIAAIIVTHKHSDHFDSTLVTNVANRHASALVTGGGQTKDLLGNNIQKRFITVADSLTKTINAGLLIRLKKIPHINPARHATVDNYRTEVLWNGFRVIHFGDAEILPSATSGIERSPDIAIVPEWFLGDRGIPYLNQLRPANIIVTHIDPLSSKPVIPVALNAAVLSFSAYGDKVSLNETR